MSIKAILFDLDDTLYDEKQFVKSGFSKVSEFIEREFKINKKNFYSELIDIFEKGSRGDIFNLALENLNIFSNNDIVSSMLEVYRTHTPKIKLDRGVRPLLKSLKKNYTLGIITDGHFEVQKKKVQTLKLEELFDSIIYTDKYGKEYWKPNIFSYKLALKKLQVLPKETIYIGDNPNKDFIGAKKLGMVTVRILKADREYSRVNKPSQEYRAHYQIEELIEILEIINNLNH